MDKQAYPQMRQIPYRVWARYFGTGAQSYQEALGRRHDRRNVFELCFEGWQHLVFICFDVPRLLSHSPATTTSQFKKKKPSAYVVGLSQLHREHQHPFQLMLLLQHAKKCAYMPNCFSRVRLFVTLWTSPPGSSVHGILQERILEWVAVLTSRGSFNPGIKPVSHTSLALTGGFFTTSTTWKARSAWPHDAGVSAYLDDPITSQKEKWIWNQKARVQVLTLSLRSSWSWLENSLFPNCPRT